MEITWQTMSELERTTIAEVLCAEGEKQSVIDVVLDQSKELSIATLQSIDDLKAIVMHDLAKRSGFPWKAQLASQGQSRTIGGIWERMKRQNVQFEDDWCRLRVFVSFTSEVDRMNGCGGEYLIKDGAHRIFAFLRLLDEDKINFQFIPVYSTEMS